MPSRAAPASSAPAPLDGSGASVPAMSGPPRSPALLSPAARKAVRQRMLSLRPSSVDRIRQMTDTSLTDLRRFRQELREGGLSDQLLGRGAGLPFAREFPQGALVYVLVRALRPRLVVETGVRPGYTTAWMLAALEANRFGELTSIGPGSGAGRAPGVHGVSVGQFVAPALRARWTLVLGNSPGQLDQVLADRRDVDLFLYDNGPEAHRARAEMRAGWNALTRRGILLAHRVDANDSWNEFCRAQGQEPQLLDAGPPPMGALSMSERPA